MGWQYLCSENYFSLPWLRSLSWENLWALLIMFSHTPRIYLRHMDMHIVFFSCLTERDTKAPVLFLTVNFFPTHPAFLPLNSFTTELLLSDIIWHITSDRLLSDFLLEYWLSTAISVLQILQRPIQVFKESSLRWQSTWRTWLSAGWHTTTVIIGEGTCNGFPVTHWKLHHWEVENFNISDFRQHFSLSYQREEEKRHEKKSENPIYLFYASCIDIGKNKCRMQKVS